MVTYLYAFGIPQSRTHRIQYLRIRTCDHHAFACVNRAVAGLGFPAPRGLNPVLPLAGPPFCTAEVRNWPGRRRTPPRCAFLGHDHHMGSANDKPRKRRRPLPKVPKYEEPNTLPLPGLTGDSGLGNTSGRFGHGSDGKEHHAPGRAGRAILRLLGMRRRDPETEDPVTRKHED
jgi:hypothetical protein